MDKMTRKQRFSTGVSGNPLKFLVEHLSGLLEEESIQDFQQILKGVCDSNILLS